MKEAVLDASVAIALLTREAGADAAADAVRDVSVVVPDAFWAEVTRALVRKVGINDLSEDEARSALALLGRLVERAVPSRRLAPAALDLSLALRHPTYDCFYLAAAVDQGIPLLTADRELCERAAEGGLGALVEFVE